MKGRSAASILGSVHQMDLRLIGRGDDLQVLDLGVGYINGVIASD
jgi:hypothetical protein